MSIFSFWRSLLTFKTLGVYFSSWLRKRMLTFLFFAISVLGVYTNHRSSCSARYPASSFEGNVFDQRTFMFNLRKFLLSFKPMKIDFVKELSSSSFRRIMIRITRLIV